MKLPASVSFACNSDVVIHDDPRCQGEPEVFRCCLLSCFSDPYHTVYGRVYSLSISSRAMVYPPSAQKNRGCQLEDIPRDWIKRRAGV